jgi:hypothetical protein
VREAGASSRGLSLRAESRFRESIKKKYMPDQFTPPAGPNPSGLFGWFNNANNFLTTIGTLLAAAAAIFSTINRIKVDHLDAGIKALDAKVKNVDVQLKELEFLEKVQKSSNDYAQIFLDRVMSEKKVADHEKRIQATLSVLNIVAQASGSQSRESDPRMRTLVPISLALILGEPGGVAAMDVNYEHLDDWVAIACADNSAQTRGTAIQALVGISEKAMRQHRLDILVRSVEAIDQLFALLPDEKLEDAASKDLRLKAKAARLQLGAFISKQSSLLDAAVIPVSVGPALPGETADQTKLRLETEAQQRIANETKQRAAVREAFKAVLNDDAYKLQENAQELNKKLAELDEGGAAESKRVEEVKTTLAQVNAALASVTQAKVGPVSESETENAIAQRIQDLVNPEDKARKKARADLALFGQTAVKPLLTQVEGRFGQNGEADYKTRLGVAVALKLMRQPIVLDRKDAYWVVSLLRSNDSETRSATSEFLMNLESGQSVRYCYDALESLFWELSVFRKHLNVSDADTMMNIVVVVGTWGRNLTPDNQSREANKTLPAFALQTAREWRSILKDDKWKNARETLDDLIKRAEVRLKK